MKVVYFGLSAKQKSWLKSQRSRYDWRAAAGPITLKHLPSQGTEVISIHTESRITSAILDKLPNLKLIVTRTAGVDHIDLAACHRRKVAVVNCPGLNASSVAEFTFALLLSYQRRLPEALQDGKKLLLGSEKLAGLELAGKTLGIVGTGAIGQRVAQIGAGFGMKLLGYDAKRNAKAAKKLGLTYLGLKQLLQRSDVVSIHVPATPLTEHMFNRSLLGHIKHNAILVNTARGSVVEPKAVLWALDNGKLQAYLTDVLDKEQQIYLHGRATPKDRLIIKWQKQLLRHPRVLATPHIAHYTAESELRILEYTHDSIGKFLSGKKISAII